MTAVHHQRRLAVPGRHVYDVIVIGGQLGGAISTALLARHGLKVLHVAHDGLVDGYVHDEWRLPLVPCLLPPLESVRAFEEVLVDLGMATVAHRTARPPVPQLQLLTNDTWLALPADEAARLKELTAELGETNAEAFAAKLKEVRTVCDGADAFFGARPDLPPEGMIARWKFNRLLAKTDELDLAPVVLPKELAPLPLLNALLPFSACVDAPVPLSHARVLGKVLHGPDLWPGGCEGLSRALLDRCCELGSDVLTADAAVQQVVLDGSKTVGVRLARGDSVYKAEHVIAACDVATLRPLLPEAKQHAFDKLALEAPRLLFGAHAVVPDGALPPGLGELALVQGGDEALGPVLLERAPARKQGAEADAPGMQVLSLWCVVPAAERGGGEPAFRKLADRVWAQVEGVLPFTRKKATLQSLPWLDAPTVVSGAVEPHPLFSLPAGAPLGVAGLTTSSPFKRLWLASRQVLPGLGFEGEVLAARRAVGMIEGMLKKMDPLKERRAGA